MAFLVSQDLPPKLFKYLYRFYFHLFEYQHKVQNFKMTLQMLSLRLLQLAPLSLGEKMAVPSLTLRDFSVLITTEFLVYFD
jgi:hypothetical protein